MRGTIQQNGGAPVADGARGVINGAIAPAPGFEDILGQMRDQGTTVMPGIGSDVADPSVKESAYEGTPVEASLSLFESIRELGPHLGDVRCPVLIITSRNDHV